MNLASRPPIRVVVVDDDAMIRDLLAEFVIVEPTLQLVGVAATGEAAVAMCIHDAPDVAIIDVRMPGGGGIWAVGELSKLLPSVRVVALSAYADRDAIRGMLMAGAVGYIVKGSSLELILEAVQKAAMGQRVLSPAVASAVVDELQDVFARGDEDRTLHQSRLTSIRAVLAHDGPTMVFQPIFDIESGSVAGYEALARFLAEPHRPPDEWFAEAHSVGLGVDLETMAIATAAKSLRLLSPSMFVAVNLGPATALAVERLAAALEDTDLRRIVLEITEHAPVTDYVGLKAALKPLRDAGVRLSVDDAGAGYASLRHILNLEPDVIKLDISITHDIDTHVARRALARGLSSFGREIGTHIIGEGVETAAELATLRDLGVSFAQGYFLGMPASLPEMVAATTNA